jgi:hypothetical protein
VCEKVNSDGIMHRKPRSAFFTLRRPSLQRSLLVMLAVAFLGVSSGTMWAQSTSDEYQVKAAFLFHFAQLVQWPTDAPSDGGISLLVCTLGNDPFRGELENTIAGKQIGSRILRIRHVKSLQDAGGCNMLFIGKGEGKRIPSPLANLRNTPVLTIGEAEGFLGTGGMIRLCLDGKKVRFEINREAAESARLKISSQLLLLAKSIVGGNGGSK